MKLVYPEIESVFHFGNGCFPTVVIENPGLFYRFIDDLYRQCAGEDGNSVLSLNDTPLSVSGNLDLLTNFFPFEINRKNLIAKITAKLEKQALSPEFYERSQHLLSDIEKFIFDIAYQNDFDLEMPRLSIAGLLKSAGVCLKEDDLPLAEKILTYMDLMSSNKLASVFIFVNLRSFLDGKTMENFTDCCCCHEYNIMLIDNCGYNKLSREQRTTIDIDLCEF
ncbi:MAG: type II-A CRISPR-associated protein Csn2 [Lentisphaeria bacterium]|nr:type II-A CRISPR-associated protein Csn2 [Lentisphaeria bacterium]MBR2626573.1 type II-A CRISPR-associated protein Csn2 [Lentisphaeria bacterium]